MVVLDVILYLILAYLAFNVCYLLFFAISGMFYRNGVYREDASKRRIAVIIPAYKEDGVIVQTAEEALRQNYPSSHYSVVVVADGLQPVTLNALRQLPIHVLEVSYLNSTKAKAIRSALDYLTNDYFDIAMILDADNFMAAGCLEKVNSGFGRGYRMVQLHRTAKNKNTSTAILDALSEEINNYIFRRGHRAIGISSAMIGSGMAFDYESFSSLMNTTGIEENPGEDREIYLEMLKRGEVCEYFEDALVFDEKVQSTKVLERQRTRWISAQLQYAKKFWITEVRSIFSYNIHYFDYAVQTLLLPRAILVMVTFFGVLLSLVGYFVFGGSMSTYLYIWLILFFCCMFSLFVGSFGVVSIRQFLGVLLNIPMVLVSYLKALVRSRPDQREFIHTPKEFEIRSKIEAK